MTIASAYGQFLDEDLLSIEQKEAREALISELDNVDVITVPKDLLLWARKNNENESMKNNFLRLKEEYSQSYEDFNEEKKEKVKSYLEKEAKTYSN